MSTRPQVRFTIGQTMVLIASMAILWALVATPGSARFFATILLPIVAVVVGPVLIIHHLLDGSIGVGCPNCGEPTMERRAVSSFGSRFYRCTSCGVRCQRGPFGSWEDASGPEYEHRYRKKPQEDPWTAPPGLEDEDLIYSKTHVNLVRSKRQRRPDNPNGPGLD